MKIKPRLLGITAILASMAGASAAWAGLGGDVRSVSADQQLMQGRLQMTPMQQYDLHQITTSGGTVIHEYVTRQGQVFAVTWNGPFQPNLRQLFGSYYSQYQTAAAASAPRSNHRTLSIQQSDFVVQAIGRMRAYRGRAYIPSLVPGGVSVTTLP